MRRYGKSKGIANSFTNFLRQTGREFSASQMTSAHPGVRRQLGVPVERLALENVAHIIAVASGKGGVGKSTTAVNLAVAMARDSGLRVGLLDSDVYGPSIPRLMNLEGKPQVNAAQKMIPLENYGVRCMSMGFLMDHGAPAVWRGQMVMKALEQLVRGVAWGTLDVMVIDMPPGTGDAQISITQRLPLSGAVIVTTPQDIALIDARRGANMFRIVEVPILGLVENMSYFCCPSCGTRSEIFGHGGGRKTAEEMDMEFLGEVPLNTTIRETSDSGRPITSIAMDSTEAKAYSSIALRIVDKLRGVGVEGQRQAPRFVVD